MATNQSIVISSFNEARKRYPFPIDTIVWLFNYVVGFVAFPVRAFLRRAIGSNTVLLLDHIIVSFFWVRYFMTDIPIKSWDKDLGFWKNVGQRLLEFFSPQGSFIENITWFKLLPPNGGSIAVLYFSYLLLIAGFYHYTEAFQRPFRYEKVSSTARGESRVFGWLKESQSWRKNLPRLNDFILVLFDPIFAFSVATVIGIYFEDFGLCLQISSIALFIEEYKAFSLKREAEQQAIDGELGGIKLQENLDEYDKQERTTGSNQRKGFGTVVTSGDKNDYAYVSSVILAKRKST